MRDRRIFTPLTVLLKKSMPRSRSIEADTRAENTASVRVLVRNGFVQFGHSKRSFQLKGTWYDRLHFERHLDA
jgi:RimJ/RimL family protein N-acetyltransferase